jgi:hypothetical protein
MKKTDSKINVLTKFQESLNILNEEKILKSRKGSFSDI